MIKNSSNARGNAVYEGFIPDLMDAISDLGGFDYELHLVRDNKYGRRQPNGKWNGMVGELVRGVRATSELLLRVKGKSPRVTIDAPGFISIYMGTNRI